MALRKWWRELVVVLPLVIVFSGLIWMASNPYPDCYCLDIPCSSWTHCPEWDEAGGPPWKVSPPPVSGWMIGFLLVLICVCCVLFGYAWRLEKRGK